MSAAAGLTAAILAPQVQPAAAAATALATVAHDGVAVSDAPVQLAGSPQGLPSLLPATQLPSVAEPSDGWHAEVKAPEGAVPLEDRSVDSATSDSTEGLPVGTLRAEAAERSVLAVPALLDVYPKQGYLVDSLTPSLRAWGQSTNAAGSALSYSFKVCDVESMSGAGCTSSGYVAGNANKWTVPAGKLAWGKQYWWTVTVKDSYDSSTTTSPLLTFVTGVRQPAVTSWLASAGVDGREFNQQTGNYTTTVTDLQVATVGPPLSVVRTYNSMDSRTEALFGAGWSTRWDMRIASETHGTSISAVVTYPDGRRIRFLSDGTGGFQPPPGMFATLALQRDGWRLMDKAGTSYLFGADGRLTKISDNRNRVQELVYGSDGKLAKVATVGGRSLTFTWNGAHIASVFSDPVDGITLTWTYEYDGDRLTKVCAPVAAPNCTTYEYGSGSLYRSGVLDADPLGYWRMGEASGTTAKDLGTGAGDATYQSVTLGQQGALAGTTDTAASFGAGSRMNLPSHTIPHVGDQMAVETWFKTSQSGVLLAAGSQQTSGVAQGPMLYVGTDGKLRGSLTVTTSPITSGQAVNDGQWHHVVLSVEGQEQRLFLDGQQAGTLTTTRPAGWRQYATVGNGITDAATSPAVPAGTAAFAFQGVIDEVAVYGAPLLLEQVKAHYQARNAAPHRLSKITLPSGRVAAVNTYNDRTDRIATHTDSNGGTWKIGDLGVEQQSGEAQVTVTDPANNTLKYLYDAWRGYNIRGETDQLGYTTWYEYDQAGFLAKVIDRNDIANEIYQDKRGNTLGRQYCRAPGECAIEFWSYYLNTSDPFDLRNDKVTAYRDGRSSRDTDNTYATTTEYNTYGELIRQSSPITADFPLGRSTTTGYTDGSEAAVGGGTTPAGLVKTKTDARGNSWSYRYTAAGDLAEQTSPEGLVTKLEYDSIGRLTASTQISQAVPGGAKTTFTYDGRGRVLTATSPAVKNELSDVTHTAQVRSTYDADGNPLTQTIADLTGGDPKRTTTYTYDTFGRQDSITDPEGGVARQVWNQLGQTIRATDARGTIIEQGYSKRGELVFSTLKGWTGSPVNPQPATDVVLETRGYDAAGRLKSTVDAMGRKTTNEYWMDNRLKQQIADDAKLNGSTTPRDVVVRAEEYDPAGNLIEQVTGGGITTAVLDYDEASRLVREVVDPAKLARATTFTYDANDNIIKSTRTAAGTSRTETASYAYNKLNQVTKHTIENGAQDQVLTLGYDERGLVTSMTDPRGNGDGVNAADYTTTQRYDVLGRLVETIAPQVQVEKDGTATQAQPTVRVGYDSAGNTTHRRDAEGRTMVSAYDKAGRVTSTTAPGYTPPGSGTAITSATHYTYDPAGQLKTSTDPRGNITSHDYDQLGRQVRTTDPAPDGQSAGPWVTEYDLAGEKLAGIDPTGARVQATYDDLGRQITVTQIERKPTAASYTTTMEYDDAGRLTKQTAPGNRVTSFTVNAAGEITSTTDPLLKKTTLDHDLSGRLVKTIDPNGNATTADYDLAGRKTIVKDLVESTGAVLRTYGLGYDLAGNQTSATSPEGHVTKQTFDALGRLTSLIEPVSDTESITTTFGYDAAGARTRITDGRGNATWTSYNSLGLPETLTEPATTAHPDVADRTWTHLYDAAGNQTATIQPGGVRTDRVFDQLNRLTKETGAGGGATSAERTLGYDLAGHLISAGDITVDLNDRGLPLKVTRGTVQETAYTYDALGNPTQRVDAAGTATFTWDNGNRLATATDPVTARTLTYDYDNASRLKTITATSGTAGTQTIDYDNMNRVTGQTVKNGSGTQLAKITYGWDKDDNLTTKTTAGTIGAGTNTYGYDHAGRLTSWTAPGGAVTSYEWDASGNRTKAGSATFTYDERNRLTSGDGTDYTYTPRGTLATSTKAGATTNYTFDAFDRMIADGDSLYAYDALDRAVSRIRGTTKQTFAYTGLDNDLAAVTDSGGAVQAKYARDPGGGLLGLKEGTGVAVAALSDLHGDLVATYTASVQASAAYDPFGTVTALTGTKAQLGYQGEYTDPDTGKVNMHARWYQPGTGTFASRDTATLDPNPSVQANRYSYANASPLTGADPTGHYSSGLGFDTGSSGYSGTVIGSGITLGSGSSSSGSGYYSGGSGSGDISAYAGTQSRSGGGYICTGNICAETFTNQQWWSDFITSPGYDYYNAPLMSDKEAKKQGLMPNGRPAPKDFWKGSALARDIFMRTYTPVYSSAELQNQWNFVREVLDGTPRSGSSGASAGGKTTPSPDFGSDEGEWCKKNPADCAMAFSITNEAYRYVDKKFGEKETDKKNAVRHFLWQVTLAYVIGQDAAVSLAEAHEKGEACRPKRARCDTAADQYNNAFSRSWAKSHEKELDRMYRSSYFPTYNNATFSYTHWFDQLYAIADKLYSKGQLHDKYKRTECRGSTGHVPNCA
ncbi:RHS repeat-associated core domain-containing protein [Actinomadura sp. ATCC 39365]